MTTLPDLPPGLAPDIERGLRFLAAQRFPGELVQCGVTGAHYYGFPSPDSDIDLKGVHLAPTEELLGLSSPAETFDVLTDFEEVEHDLTTHEAAMALGLLLRGNGNVLERFLSPFQLVPGAVTESLAELAEGAIAKSFHRHYRGFFSGMRREHTRERRAKTMLYSYRVALTGTHLLRTGELVGDVRVLAPRYGFEEVTELVELKGRTREKAVLDEPTDARFRARWPALEEALADALEASELPEEPPNRDAMERWLRETRLRALGG